MRKVELTIEFTGITRKFAADCLARYFGTEVKVGLGSGYLVKDKLGRDWTVTYAKSVRADGYLKEDEADDYKNCINTPELYISADVDDSNLIHDLLVVLRSCGAMLNELCSMHVLVGCPSDQRKAGVYLSEYCKYQDKQIEMFKTSAAYTARYAKPYQYQTDAYEIDDYSDIVSYVESTYASVPNFDEEFSSKYALNFLSAAVFGKLEFKAFNSSFDEEYVKNAVHWVDSFMSHCDEVYANSWLNEYLAMRA